MTNVDTNPEDMKALAREHYIWPLLHRDDNDREPPLVVAKGRDCHLVDVDGNEYLDMMSGITRASTLGHSRRELLEAISSQAGQLAYAGTAGQVADVTIKLAKKLVDLAPGDLHAVAFSGSGSEANETAFKIAKAYQQAGEKPRAYKIISRLNAYHGATGAAGSASDLLDVRNPAEPGIPGFSQIPSPLSYRGQFKYEKTDEPGKLYAEYLEREILHQDPDLVLAFIAEPIMQANGVQIPPTDYFPRVREVCDRYGVLLIMDEVICGFGRTGAWFGSNHFGIEPDIMTCAKGLTAGYGPMGATLITSKLQERLSRLADVHTFGGHALAAAAASAAIDIYSSENLPDRAMAVGGQLRTRLQDLVKHDVVGEVRGLGMWMCVDFTTDRATKEPLDRYALGSIVMEARKRGVIVGRNGTAIELAPPLTIELDEALYGIDQFDEAIRTVADRLSS